MGKIRCDLNDIPTVAIGQYDPITNHNGTGAAHEHQFFGNTAWHVLPNPNTANYADLVGKQNNCRNVLGLPYSADSAGYWTPTLRYKAGTPKAGQLIAGRQFPAYFRGYNGQTFGPGMAFPADTRLIASDDYGKGAHGWNCGQFSAQAQRDGTVNHIPDCTGEPGGPRRTLTAHINFPTCWDGVLPNHQAGDVGDTRDNAHYRYPSGKGVCPARVPQQDGPAASDDPVRLRRQRHGRRAGQRRACRLSRRRDDACRLLEHLASERVRGLRPGLRDDPDG